MSAVCTDEGRGHSCCPLSRCDPRRWMRVPTSCSCVLSPCPDWPSLLCLWAFSVWVSLGWIQSLGAHTLHLEQDRDSQVSNQADSALHGLILAFSQLPNVFKFQRRIHGLMSILIILIEHCKYFWFGWHKTVERRAFSDSILNKSFTQQYTPLWRNTSKKLSNINIQVYNIYKD